MAKSKWSHMDLNARRVAIARHLEWLTVSQLNNNPPGKALGGHIPNYDWSQPSTLPVGQGGVVSRRPPTERSGQQSTS